MNSNSEFPDSLRFWQKFLNLPFKYVSGIDQCCDVTDPENVNNYKA